MKKFYLPLVALVMLMLASCSKKMGELSSDYFTVTPQVLEAVGGKVPVTIDGKFPEKYFKKKAVVEVTPVLKWDGGEAKGQSAAMCPGRLHTPYTDMPATVRFTSQACLSVCTCPAVVRSTDRAWRCTPSSRCRRTGALASIWLRREARKWWTSASPLRVSN